MACSPWNGSGGPTLEPSSSWDPPLAGEPVPWEQVEASLRIPQRWPEPHKLSPRIPELPRRAAVAVLLWGDARGAQDIVLIRRGHSAPQHGGELAFPGGMAEPFDRDLPATARRELEEELGVTEGLWELGCFPDGVAKARTRFTPVFLRWEVPQPAFVLGSEIAAVLRLPLTPLMAAPWFTQRLEIQGRALDIPRLELRIAPLWGATAMVLKAWLDVLSSVRIGRQPDTLLEGPAAPSNPMPKATL
jgi:8-oxo-dGTP pyrophosphatase MutT (NUDIX family)